jgi:hypothetical protein
MAEIPKAPICEPVQVGFDEDGEPFPEAPICKICNSPHWSWQQHSLITGTVDAQIAVKRDEAGNKIALVEEMKDGPDGAEIVSRLESVQAGFDEAGEPITSCAIVPVQDASSTPNGQRPKEKNRPPPAKSHLNLEFTNVTIVFTGTIEACAFGRDAGSWRSVSAAELDQLLASRARISVPFGIESEVGTRKGPVRPCGLVKDGNVRRDLLLFDEPSQTLG